jgi:hypothetical protein
VRSDKRFIRTKKNKKELKGLYDAEIFMDVDAVAMQGVKKS